MRSGSAVAKGHPASWACAPMKKSGSGKGCGRSRLLPAPDAVAAIGGGTSLRRARGRVDDLHAPRPYPAGCKLRLLVADTDLGDADGIRSGSIPSHAFGGRRGCPCMEG